MLLIERDNNRVLGLVVLSMRVVAASASTVCAALTHPALHPTLTPRGHVSISVERPSYYSEEILLRIELIGSNTASSEGITLTFERRDPIAPLCRKLIARGHSPDEVVHIERAGVLAFVPAMLRAWAARDTTDNDKRGLITRKWKPFEPSGQLAHLRELTRS